MKLSQCSVPLEHHTGHKDTFPLEGNSSLPALVSQGSAGAWTPVVLNTKKHNWNLWAAAKHLQVTSRSAGRTPGNQNQTTDYL